MLSIEGTRFDNIIHIVTAILAFSLFIISLRVYLRAKNKRFLYVCSAFLLFAIKEIIVVADILFLRSPTAVGISHTLNFVILILFFMGVIKQ